MVKSLKLFAGVVAFTAVSTAAQATATGYESIKLPPAAYESIKLPPVA